MDRTQNGPVKLTVNGTCVLSTELNNTITWRWSTHTVHIWLTVFSVCVGGIYSVEGLGEELVLIVGVGRTIHKGL